MQGHTALPYTCSFDVENVNDVSNASNGKWRSYSGLNRLQSLPREGSNHSSKKAPLVRDKLKDNFIGPGQVP